MKISSHPETGEQLGSTAEGAREENVLSEEEVEITLWAAEVDRPRPKLEAAVRRYQSRRAACSWPDAKVSEGGLFMQEATFWRTATRDHADLLGRTLHILRETGARYCVIADQAVNAYAEPVVSLDLDLALAPGELERLGALFGPPIRTERFEHSLNLSASGSDLRIQFQIDPCYHDFPARAEVREVLGHRLPVARLEDVLHGKV